MGAPGKIPRYLLIKSYTTNVLEQSSMGDLPYPPTVQCVIWTYRFQSGCPISQIHSSLSSHINMTSYALPYDLKVLYPLVRAQSETGAYLVPYSRESTVHRTTTAPKHLLSSGVSRMLKEVLIYTFKYDKLTTDYMQTRSNVMQMFRTVRRQVLKAVNRYVPYVESMQVGYGLHVWKVIVSIVQV